MLAISLTSIFVDNQENALAFYTGILGFVKQQDILVGNFRWLTVVAPADLDGVELLLEPNAHPAAATYQRAIRADGISATAWAVDDVVSEYERMTAQGVTFTMPPTPAGPTTIAVFDDTCGNLIQLYQS